MKGAFKTLKKLLKITKQCQIYLWLALICIVLSTVAELFIPILSGKCIDFLIGKGQVDFNMLAKFIGIFIAVVVVFCVFSYLANWLTNKYMFECIKIVRQKLFDKINRLSIGYIEKTTHGDILSRMINDVALITDGFLEGISTLFDGIITITLTLVLMLTLNVKLSLVIIVITPFSLLVTYLIASKSRKLFEAYASTKGEVTGYLEELISGQRIVKAFNHEEDNIENFEEVNKKLYKYANSSKFISSISGPLTRFINGLVYAFVAFIGALLAINGEITVGVISMFLSYANRFGSPFNDLSSEISEIQAAFASADRVFSIMDAKEESSDINLPELLNCDGSVEVKNAFFSYVPNQKLLENLNLSVKPGQKIAIVGPTGCGKTTFINLLMRFYDLTYGTIYVSGTDIYNVKRHSLRSKYGMVLQESWMFNTTVRENIAYGKPNATLEEVIEAAKMAGAHDFIEKMPKGYDTIISESGSNLSQGQKQLLCIARIMLIKPPMLILDEATSNIDTRTELQIQKAFDIVMEGRTTFIVAHRLSTIKNADKILVMNKGNIIEQGTHTELLAKKGFYYHLYNSQFAGQELDEETGKQIEQQLS